MDSSRDNGAGGGEGCLADPSTVTRLLRASNEGDSGATKELLDHVYQHLHAIACQRMAFERSGHTLQPTALVHEAYVKLVGGAQVNWQGRGHFFRVAAESMKRVLIDHAMARNTSKRGGGRAALQMSSVLDIATLDDLGGIQAMENAIERLSKVDARAAEVVQLRFYAGLSEDTVSEVLGISARTVRREWVFARAWLRDSLQREIDSGGI